MVVEKGFDDTLERQRTNTLCYWHRVFNNFWACSGFDGDRKVVNSLGGNPRREEIKIKRRY